MKQEPPFLVGGSAGRAFNALTVGGISSHGRASYELGEYWSQRDRRNRL